MSMLVEIVVSALLVLGGLFTLLGAIGLARLPDFYTRLHAPTKATTLGVGCIILAVLLHRLATADFSWPELSVTLFLFITAPVTAHVMAKAARARGLPVWNGERQRAE